jgi:hypothetical protein
MNTKLALKNIMLLIAMLMPIFCLADFKISDTQGLVIIYFMTVVPALLYALNILVFLSMLFKSKLGKGIFYLIIVLNLLLVIIIVWPRDSTMDDGAIFWFGYFPAALSLFSILRRYYLFKVNIFTNK